MVRIELILILFIVVVAGACCCYIVYWLLLVGFSGLVLGFDCVWLLVVVGCLN